MGKTKTFKDWLRENMATADVTQQDVADAIGCKQTTVSQWLSGRNGPSRVYLARLAKFFDVDKQAFAAMFEWIDGADHADTDADTLERQAIMTQINRDLRKLDDVVLRMLKDQIHHVFLAHSDELNLLRKKDSE